LVGGGSRLGLACGGGGGVGGGVHPSQQRGTAVNKVMQHGICYMTNDTMSYNKFHAAVMNNEKMRIMTNDSFHQMSVSNFMLGVL
jgi:hypothetical protein